MPDVSSSSADPSEPRSAREQRILNGLPDSPFVSAVRRTYGGLGGLHEVTGRPPLHRYIKQLWQRRHFVWSQSRSRVATENDDNRLGSLWLILKPLLDAIFYWLVFGLLLRLDRGMDNYIAFVIIGVFMYQYTSTALSSGTKTINNNRAMIRAFQFPRMALPLADLVYDFLQRTPAIGVMFVIIIAMPPHELPELAWLLFLAVLALQLMLNFGFMLILARLGTIFPDISKFMPFATRLLMYGSGVIFPIDRVADRFPALMAVIELNPVYVFLQMYRQILIDGTVPDLHHWLILTCWAVGVFVVGFFTFYLGEESYGRDRRR